jgi:hypothetical protein
MSPAYLAVIAGLMATQNMTQIMVKLLLQVLLLAKAKSLAFVYLRMTLLAQPIS